MNKTTLSKMAKNFYHSKGCNSATIQLGERTVLYSIRSPEVKQYCGSILRTRNPNYEGSYGSEPEFVPPRVETPKLVIVAGYVVGEVGKGESSGMVPVTEVEPITDQSEREELTDLLGEKQQTAKFSFWNKLPEEGF